MLNSSIAIFNYRRRFERSHCTKMAMFRDGGYVVPNAGIFMVENDDEPAEFRHTLY